MIVLFGKTCSGKTTVAEALEKKGIEKVVTVTTRKKRPGEVMGRDYIFITQEFFDSMESRGEFAETARYVMAGNIPVSYGSLRRDYENGDKVIVLSPSGLKAVREAGIDVFAVYVSLDDEIIRQRLISRGDDPAEAKRRLKADDADFRDAEKLADLVIDGNADPGKNVEIILHALRVR